jgi:RloB-like protein
MRHIPTLSRSKAATVDQKIKLTVFCEDLNAAPDYFHTLKRAFESAIVEIEDIHGGSGEPKTIANKAILKRKQINQRKRDDKSVDRDQVWAVFDRDEHIWFDDAISMCKSGDVNVGYANPCFELWILLHQNDCHNSGDDRHEVQRACKRFLPGYDRRRGKTADFTELCKNVQLAERNGDWLNRQRETEGATMGRPSTTIQNLTRVIRGEI